MLVPEDNAGRPHVLALEEEAGRAEGQGHPARGARARGGGWLMTPEDEAGCPKVPMLEEVAVAPDVLAEEADRPEIFT